MAHKETTSTAGEPPEQIAFTDKPEGPISAAIIAAGIGAAALGLLTTLAEASTTVKDWLQFSDSVGPLSGKTIVAVVVWLLAWIALHIALRNKPYESGRALTICLILLGLGILGTFPIFFQAFAAD